MQEAESKPTLREQYLAGELTFTEYYRHVNERAGIKITDKDTIVRIHEALAKGDEHLNSIPHTSWDGLAAPYKQRLSAAFKEAGDFWSLAGGVCALKQAARDAVSKE